jgi:hypothetical protein
MRSNRSIVVGMSDHPLGASFLRAAECDLVLWPTSKRRSPIEVLAVTTGFSRGGAARTSSWEGGSSAG